MKKYAGTIMLRDKAIYFTIDICEFIYLCIVVGYFKLLIVSLLPNKMVYDVGLV